MHYLHDAPRLPGPVAPHLRPPKGFAVDQAFQPHVCITELLTYYTLKSFTFSILLLFLLFSRVSLIFQSYFLFPYFLILSFSSFFGTLFFLSNTLSSETKRPGSDEISSGGSPTTGPA